MKSSAIIEILTEIERYPYFLFLNDLSNINKEIAALPWNCILTTITDISSVENLFKLQNRQCRIVTSPEEFDKLPNKKNMLNIVFLQGINSIESISIEQKMKLKTDITQYFNIIPSLVLQFGHIVFDSIKFTPLVTEEKINEFIYKNRKQSIYIFNFAESLIEKEILSTKEVLTANDSLNDSFINEDLSLYTYKDSNNSNSSNQLNFFINNKRVCKTKTEYSDFLKTFNILTDNEIQEISVPDYLHSNYFYLFLQNSANDYCWYGYENKFNYVRPEDKNTLDIVKNSLNNIQKNNYILLYGQSGSGKTITVNYIAYKIFSEHKYPVIYLKKNQIDFFKNTERAFSHNIEYSNPGYSLLDDFIKDLEDEGAKNILLVCDLSCYSEDYSQTYESLARYLHNRGRNFVLLCTGYAKSEKNIIQQELSVLFSKSNNQIKSFIDYITPLASLSNEEIETIKNFINTNKEELNLFSIFYHFFAVTRPTLTQGIRKEAEVSIQSVLQHCKDNNSYELSLMQLALKQAGLIDDIDIKKSISIKDQDIQTLLIVTAICCVYNVSFPTSLALKLLPDLTVDLIKTITSIPFFIFSEEDDDFSFSIRSPLDAKVLLNSFNVNSEGVIDNICLLIQKANLYSSSYVANREIKCIADLLHRIGPAYKLTKAEYGNYYHKIIEALNNLHENNKKIDTRIVLIEMNYMREFYDDKNRKKEISNAEFTNAMKTIISLGDSYSAISNYSKDFYYVMIKIETANTRYALCKDNTNIDELFTAKKDAEAVFALYENAYSYTIWFQTCNKIYECTQDKMILKEMLGKMDLLRAENEDIDEDTFLSKEFQKVYENLLGTSNNYIESLIQKGNAVGLYLKATKFLKENQLNMSNHADISRVQYEKYNELEHSVFSQSNLAMIERNSECLWLYIKLKWILYNGRPFFLGDKELTRMDAYKWKEILDLCSEYIRLNQNAEVERSNIIVEYLQALCYAQLEDYNNSIVILTKLRERSESYYLSNRVYSRHMLCDKNGEILKFSGRIKINPNGKISVYINKINNGVSPIFCNRNNLRNFQPENGKTDDNFQLGIGIMGFSVFHGYNGGKND